jgi:hypothetical protein
MSEHSAIEWTEATWNPTSGCTKVFPHAIVVTRSVSPCDFRRHSPTDSPLRFDLLCSICRYGGVDRE